MDRREDGPSGAAPSQPPSWRPWERADRLGQRWQTPPANVVMREDFGQDDGDAPARNGDNIGRLSVYTFNFGEVARASHDHPVIQHLADHTAHILVGQEMTLSMADQLQAKGWHLSAARFIGSSRANGGDGLVVAGRSEVCVGIETFNEVSGSVLSAERERSSILFAKVQLRWAMAGNTDYVFGNFHLHRETAKRGLGSTHMRDFIARLANGCRASGARLLCGDANMGLFLIVPGLIHFGLECRLLMHHREMNIYKPLPTTTRAARGEILYDSLGVWSIGPMSDKGMKRLTLSSRLMLGAMHPAVAEKAKGGRLKVLTRGFLLKSYVMPQFDEEPQPEDLDKVRLLWDLHGIEVVQAHAPAVPFGMSHAASSSEVWTLSRPSNEGAGTGDWNPVLEFAATCKAHLPFEGQQLLELRQASGVDLSMEWCSLDGPPRGTCVGTDHLPPFPHIREMVNNWRKFDEQGKVWGLGGHWPLYFVIGHNRTHSKPGLVLRGIAREKKNWWKSNGLWPWWVGHESEKTFWLPGGSGDASRGFSGTACSIVL